MIGLNSRAFARSYFMGDTITPFKAFVQHEEKALYYFRGALLPEYQRALDDLFVHAELLIAALTMAEHLPRTEALHLAMLVGAVRDMHRLQTRVETVEYQLRSLSRMHGHR